MCVVRCWCCLLTAYLLYPSYLLTAYAADLPRNRTNHDYLSCDAFLLLHVVITWWMFFRIGKLVVGYFLWGFMLTGCVNFIVPLAPPARLVATW